MVFFRRIPAGTALSHICAQPGRGRCNTKAGVYTQPRRRALRARSAPPPSLPTCLQKRRPSLPTYSFRIFKHVPRETVPFPTPERKCISICPEPLRLLSFYATIHPIYIWKNKEIFKIYAQKMDGLGYVPADAGRSVPVRPCSPCRRSYRRLHLHRAQGYGGSLADG